MAENTQIAPKKAGLPELIGTGLIVLGILLFLSVISFHETAGAGGSPSNLIGNAGHYAAYALFYAFGSAAFLVGPYFILTGVFFLTGGVILDPGIRGASLLCLLVASSVLIFLINGADERFSSGGGIAGRNLGLAFQAAFGWYGAFILALGILLPGIFLSARMPPHELFRYISEAWRNAKTPGSSPAVLHPPAATPPAPLQTPNAFMPGIPGAEYATAMQTEAFLEQQRAAREAARNFDSLALQMKKLMAGAVTKIEDSEEKPWLSVGSQIATEVEKLNTRPESIPASPTPAVSETKTAVSERAPAPRNAPPVYRNENLKASLRQLETVLALKNKAPEAPTAKSGFDGYFTSDESRFFFRGRGQVLSRRMEIQEPLLPPMKVTFLDEPRRVSNGLLHAERRDLPDVQDDIEEQIPEEPSELAISTGAAAGEEMGPENFSDESEEFTDVAETAAPAPAEMTRSAPTTYQTTAPKEEDIDLTDTVPRVKNSGRKYYLPPEILGLTKIVHHEDMSREIELTRARLESVMKEYGILARVVSTQRGPIITLYEVKLEPGVRVSRILGIQEEIKMNLEASSVRIIAPIPGKPTIGVEIPNRIRDSVSLGDMVRKDPAFYSKERNLSIPLGKDIAGRCLYIDLAQMPHLLIAGATGSGKSVYMNSVIASLMYTMSPEDLRFLMIDPKMVELKLYEGIPHLLHPVITDVRTASRALSWVVQEMERRYTILSRLKCRDIRSYNQRIAAKSENYGLYGDGELTPDRMSYIVVFIDELSDLMMIASKDVEDSIIRLTQKARAVGIHVIMATQRPSVDVITALIKANCPARIAFHVAQKTDSRTILDANGSETLLGRGDMLYKSPVSTNIVRLQAPLITEEEIEKIVREARKFGEPGYIEIPGDDSSEDSMDASEDVNEDLFNNAWRIVLESGKTSTSYIQRRMRIGYNRAANLIEMMEERGYLSPAMGSRPREILKRS